MTKSIVCPCGTTYNNNIDDFDKHTKKDETHLIWIKNISITCGCGEEYNYSNQINHFKRSMNHITWERGDTFRYDDVLYICRCGTIYKYGDKADHLATCFVKYKNN